MSNNFSGNDASTAKSREWNNMEQTSSVEP
jgi:hypothetical protein